VKILDIDASILTSFFEEDPNLHATNDKMRFTVGNNLISD
jgi:hypothetical protein